MIKIHLIINTENFFLKVVYSLIISEEIFLMHWAFVFSIQEVW